MSKDYKTQVAEVDKFFEELDLNPNRILRRENQQMIEDTFAAIIDIDQKEFRDIMRRWSRWIRDIDIKTKYSPDAPKTSALSFKTSEISFRIFNVNFNFTESYNRIIDSEVRVYHQ